MTNLKAGIADLLAGPEPWPRATPARRLPSPRVSGPGLTDAYLTQQVALLRPNGSIIVEEAPSSRPTMQAYLPIDRSDGFYTCSSGGLGFGVPAAVGVALGKPGQKVIGLIGDGSSMYSIQGLWTAGQLRLPITLVIIRNRRYRALEEFGRDPADAHLRPAQIVEKYEG